MKMYLYKENETILDYGQHMQITDMYMDEDRFLHVKCKMFSFDDIPLKGE